MTPSSSPSESDYNDGDMGSDASSFEAGDDVAAAGNSDMGSVFASILKQRPARAENPVLGRRRRLLSAPAEAALEQKAQAVLRRERKSALAGLRRRPDVARDGARERELRMAATKGVVQLFNAVHKHQQASDAGSERLEMSSSGKAGASSRAHDARDAKGGPDSSKYLQMLLARENARL